MSKYEKLKKFYMFFVGKEFFVYLCRVLNHLTITTVLLWQDLHNTI